MIRGRKLKSRTARNIGIRMGIGQENHCEMLFPRQFQEPSNIIIIISYFGCAGLELRTLCL
jgi:hypothetical protein